MIQSVNNEASAVGDLSLNALDSVSGGAGNLLNFGPIQISWWRDGAFYAGIKGVGGVLVGDGGVQGCDSKGNCKPL